MIGEAGTLFKPGSVQLGRPCAAAIGGARSHAEVIDVRVGRWFDAEVPGTRTAPASVPSWGTILSKGAVPEVVRLDLRRALKGQ